MTVTDPPDDATVDWDVAVPVRDGTRLRANVFRPAGSDRFPVLVCAHPYGKDRIPLRHRKRRGYGLSPQYRLMRSAPLTHSAWTSWEAPDPAFWVRRGYAVVNADLRGWGTSEGEPTLLGAQEGLDVHDLVEWAARQPWSNGRVGMSGVSYLAISQWAGAATRPPHLAAICPWEGFTDLYRDFARPGGILETGFLTVWSTMIERLSRGRVALRPEIRRRDLVDDWYADRDPDLEAIDVPALVCGSFSDHNLHSRGSFEGFERLGSTQKWLYTHRGPKWATYYSEAACAVQAAFFDHFLKGEDTSIVGTPPVRVEIRSDRTTVSEVRHVAAWPPPQTTWRTLRARADSSACAGTLEAADGSRAVHGAETVTVGPRGRASFGHHFAEDTDVVGPILVSATLSVEGDDDVPLFVGVRKFRDGREVTFEGSFGFQGDLVTHGLLLASHRALDAGRSRPHHPVHSHAGRQPLRAGEKVRVEVELLASATRFAAGDELRLEVRQRWFAHRDPIRGQFPAGYRTRARGTCTLHLGAEDGLSVTLPVS